MSTSFASRLVAIAALLCASGACKSNVTPAADSGPPATDGPAVRDSTTSDVNPVDDRATPMTDGGSTADASLDNLGIQCANDSDCGSAALTCVLPTADDPVFGGGPAHGYCTRPCTTYADCGDAGYCARDETSGQGRCLARCAQGPALMHINDPISDDSKCSARADVACAQITDTSSACVPTCGSDSDCPPGRHCDPNANVCVGTAHTGLRNGAACDPTAMPDPCAGSCQTFAGGADGGGISVCAERCVQGVSSDSPAPATWTACGGATRGLCTFSPTSGAGAGDLGICANACASQDDCDNPAFFCMAITGLTGTMGINNGWCFGAAPCPNGNTDCTIPGTSCVTTAYGPQCVSTQFPLGRAAPDGGVPDAG